MRRVEWVTVGAVGLVLVGSLGVTQCRLRAAQAAARESELEARNARAAADAGERELVARVDDTVAVFRRLVEERDIELDEVERRLLEREVEGELLEARLATVRATVQLLADSVQRLTTGSARRDSLGVVTASGQFRGADSIGVDVTADVEIPPPYVESAWRWSVVRSPLKLGLIVGCADRNATASLSGPPWLRAELSEITQDPEVCLPPPATALRPFEFQVPSVPTATVLVVGGVVVGFLLAN